MDNNELKLDEPKVKYGQNKRAINEIIDLTSKRKYERVNIYI